MSAITWDDRSVVTPSLAHGLDQDVQELAPGERIETGQRLVEEENRGSRAQGQRQPDLRLLSPDSSSAREVAGSPGRSSRLAARSASKPGRRVRDRVTCSATVSSR